MRSFVYEYGELFIKEMPEPIPNEGVIVVKMKYAGLNRRDLYIPNRLGTKHKAIILGSDGAGIIEKVGQVVKNASIGDEVIINPSLRWYVNSEAPPEEFDILGMPDHGTLAEKIVLAADQVEPKPDHLPWKEAGVIGLAGLTAYRALFTKGQLKKDETVFIPGAGRGVATFLIAFDKRVGAKVIVSSRSKEKREQALKIGADIAIDTNSDWEKELNDEKIDVVIESVGRATFNKSLSILKKGGRIVVFGATTEDTVDFNLREFFYGQYQLLGSTMGSKEELQEMMAFVEKNELRPVVDQSFFIDDTQAAMDYLDAGNQFGNVIIRMRE